MHRYFVTGTDTDVGKTIVSASLARALREAALTPAIVKLVQTGVAGGDPGDAQRAAALSGCEGIEYARFAAPADPWSAALAEGRTPVAAGDLRARLRERPGPLVAEGAGGLLVPLNAREDFRHVAGPAGLATVLVVGLRLGCINHARLTLEACEHADLRVAFVVLCERWGSAQPAYRRDVERALQGIAPRVGILPFASDESSAVEAGARLFGSLIH